MRAGELGGLPPAPEAAAIGELSLVGAEIQRLELAGSALIAEFRLRADTSGRRSTILVVFAAGAAHGTFSGLPRRIAGAVLYGAGRAPSEVLPLPCDYLGAVELELREEGGEVALLVGHGIEISRVGGAPSRLEVLRG